MLDALSLPRGSSWRCRRARRSARRPAAAVASAAPDEAEAELRRRAQGKRAKELRAFASALGVSTADCFEKSELAERVAAGWAARAAEAVRTELRRVPAGSGAAAAAGPLMSKEYVLVPLCVGELFEADYVLDTAAEALVVTDTTRDALGISASDGDAMRGVGSGGATVRQSIVLPSVSLRGKSLPRSALGAVVVSRDNTPLPDGSAGLVGTAVLRLFEVEVDFDKGCVTYWPPGSLDGGALDAEGLVSLPLSQGLAPLPLPTVDVSLNGGPAFPAILDLSSVLSAVNWAAARAAGVEPGGPEVEDVGVRVRGIDGSPMSMAMAPFSLRVGDPHDASRRVEPPNRGRAAVGDLPAFAALGLDGRPAMSLGLDFVGGAGGRVVLDVAGERLCVPAP